MIVKKHVTEDGRLILAICDNSLKGKRFEEGEKQLDLTGNFYDGIEMGEEEVLELMKKAYMVNLVGEESVATGIKAGIISEENIIKIQRIPHAQGMVVSEE